MMNTGLAYVDGAFVPAAQASVPLEDLGLQRGYGIFDYLRVAGRVPLFLADHLDRFLRSADVMRLQPPCGRKALSDIIHRLIDAEERTVSGIRILLTGGPSADGYTVTRPRLAVVRQPLASPPDSLPSAGIRLCTYAYRRQLAQVKTTDYLMAIWLQAWLRERGGDDILYHDAGQLRECPRANLFLVDAEGVLVTPSEGMLAGITRKQLLAAAERAGIPAVARNVGLEEVARAREAFITSSTKRLLPVARIDEVEWPTPGPLTQRLWDAFLDREGAYIREHAR